METTLFSFCTMALCVVLAVSCDNTQPQAPGTGESGDVRVTIGFKSTSSPDTKAQNGATKVPTTEWSDIQSLAVLFAEETTNTVVWANDVTYQLSGDASTNKTVTLSNIPTGTYTLHLIANYTLSDTQAQDYGYGGLPATSINPASYIGRSIETLYLNVATEQWNSSESGFNFESIVQDTYTAAPNYFVATETVTVTDNMQAFATATLARAVSLVRIRVNNDGSGAADNNKYVSFKDDKACVLLRRINTRYNVSTGDSSPTGNLDQSVFYRKTFLVREPINGYTGEKEIIDENFKVYSDALLFPGGSGDVSSEQLNVVVIGKVINSGIYVPSGQDEPADEGDLVAWAGNITAALVENNVMVVNLTLTTPGTLVDGDNLLPDPGTYGEIEITVELNDWADLVTVDMNI